MTDYLEAYLAAAKAAAPCEAEPKLEKASVYVEGLLKNGGPSTDVFKKGIGPEQTGDLFRKILFGTAQYASNPPCEKPHRAGFVAGFL